MLTEELMTLVLDLKKWYLQQIPSSHPAPVAKCMTPVIPTRVEEEKPTVPEEPKSPIELWAQQQFAIKEPITPIVCMGNHPLIHKLCQALSAHIAPAVCVQQLPDLHHPLLKALLIPLPDLIKISALSQKKNTWVIHQWQPPILPLHPVETYLNDPQVKRELWNILLRLFC